MFYAGKTKTYEHQFWKRFIIWATSLMMKWRYQLAPGKHILCCKKVRLSRSTDLEGYNTIYPGTSIRYSSVGRGTYISENCQMDFTKIGRFCSVGGGVKVIIGDHPTEQYASTHPAFYSALRQAGFSFVKTKKRADRKTVDGRYVVEIGNDVFIGSEVLILNGVKIGDGAVIGAGAVVTKDVPPYAVVAGVPAKVLRYRFSEPEIEFLQNLKWWDWEMPKIAEMSDNFDDIAKLKKNA